MHLSNGAQHVKPLGETFHSKEALAKLSVASRLVEQVGKFLGDTDV